MNNLMKTLNIFSPAGFKSEFGLDIEIIVDSEISQTVLEAIVKHPNFPSRHRTQAHYGLQWAGEFEHNFIKYYIAGDGSLGVSSTKLFILER